MDVEDVFKMNYLYFYMPSVELKKADHLFKRSNVSEEGPQGVLLQICLEKLKGQS